MSPLTLGIPSKGRLMEQASELLESLGLGIERSGTERGYRGRLSGMEAIDVVFLSASEIAQNLSAGKIDLGITGEDLIAEASGIEADQVDILTRLNFGAATVVVAVPQCWLDVASMADVDEVSENFYAVHGRRLRVATKYPVLTRKFFADKGVTGYRIVESLGATEGAPASGTSEIIVDITTTGSTLAANRLKVLDDGIILRSSAVFAVKRGILSDKRAVEFQKKFTKLQ